MEAGRGSGGPRLLLSRRTNWVPAPKQRQRHFRSAQGLPGCGSPCQPQRGKAGELPGAGDVEVRPEGGVCRETREEGCPGNLVAVTESLISRTAHTGKGMSVPRRLAGSHAVQVEEPLPTGLRCLLSGPSPRKLRAISRHLGLVPRSTSTSVWYPSIFSHSATKTVNYGSPASEMV